MRPTTFGVIAMLLAFARSAGASPTCHVSGGVSPYCSGPDYCFNETATIPVSGQVGPRTDQQGALLTTQEAFARGDRGVLQAVANEGITTTGSISSPFFAFDSASASFRCDDIILSGPPGWSTSVSFNIRVAGGLQADAEEAMSSSANVKVRYDYQSSFGGFGAELGSATQSNGGYSGTGAFVGGFNGVFPTMEFQARAGDTLTFEMILDVGASGGCAVFGCPSGRNAHAWSRFTDPAGFPALGPVANLPPGWTIDSVCAGIVNNRFGAAGAVPNGADVPGVPLTVANAGGGDISLSWGPCCMAADNDYEVYEGHLETFYSHDQRFCSTAGATNITFTPQPGNTYYLVVPRNSLHEGSYGQASSGSERPQGTSACLPEQVATCP